MSNIPNILIGCARSGVLGDAFRAAGCSAWECDIEPSRGNPRWHIRGDVIEAIRAGRPTDGAKWSAIVCHPPCTRLANSGVLRLYRGSKKAGGIDPVKWAEMERAAFFFRACWDACGTVPRAFENPTMHGYAVEITGLGAGNQSIQPNQFGDDASKRTVLWLSGLPALAIDPAKYCPPRWVCPICGDTYTEASLQRNCCRTLCAYAELRPRWSNQTDSGQNRLPPSADRAEKRAQTYPGIAAAMAAQWTKYLLNLNP